MVVAYVIFVLLVICEKLEHIQCMCRCSKYKEKDFIRIDLFLMSMQSMHSVHKIDTFNGTYVDAVDAIELV